MENYNGMEKSAKVGGYVAPSCAALVILLIFLECCNRAKWGGKCIPCILLLGAVICQGITFLIFNSELFCNNKDIIECTIGDGGYRSIQSTLVYSFCFILYTFGPTPIPLFKNIQSKIHRVDEEDQRRGKNSGKKKTKKKGKKKKKKLTEPGKGEDWTKEMYEARRKERKVKSRGVSGRRKEEIFDDMGMGGGSSPKEFGDSRENSMMLYDTDQQYQGKERKSGKKSSSGSKSRSSRGSSSSRSRSKHKEPTYDEYVDTEPDGMDWSAFTPEQREEYHEQQRSKERKRKDRERRERDKMQQWEEDGLGNPYGGSGSDYSSRRREDEEMGGGSRAYSVIDYENGSVRHGDSYYSRDSRAQDSYYSQDRGGDGYDDSYYSRGDDRGRDDYQQDDYTADYYEDEDLPPKQQSSSSRHSRSASGRSRGSQYNDSYYSRDSYDRDSRYQDNL